MLRSADGDESQPERSANCFGLMLAGCPSASLSGMHKSAYAPIELVASCHFLCPPPFPTGLAMSDRELDVFVVSGDQQQCDRLKTALDELNHRVVRTTESGHELMHWMEDDQPDFVFVGRDINDIDCFELANNLSESHCCPAIVMVSRDGLDRAKRVMMDRMTGIIVTPITAAQLRPAMYVARRRFEQVKRLRQRIQDLRRRVYSPSIDCSTESPAIE